MKELNHFLKQKPSKDNTSSTSKLFNFSIPKFIIPTLNLKGVTKDKTSKDMRKYPIEKLVPHLYKDELGFKKTNYETYKNGVWQPYTGQEQDYVQVTHPGKYQVKMFSPIRVNNVINIPPELELEKRGIIKDKDIPIPIYEVPPHSKRLDIGQEYLRRRAKEYSKEKLSGEPIQGSYTTTNSRIEKAMKMFTESDKEKQAKQPGRKYVRIVTNEDEVKALGPYTLYNEAERAKNEYVNSLNKYSTKIRKMNEEYGISERRPLDREEHSHIPIHSPWSINILHEDDFNKYDTPIITKETRHEKLFPITNKDGDDALGITEPFDKILYGEDSEIYKNLYGDKDTKFEKPDNDDTSLNRLNKLQTLRLQNYGYIDFGEIDKKTNENTFKNTVRKYPNILSEIERQGDTPILFKTPIESPLELRHRFNASFARDTTPGRESKYVYIPRLGPASDYRYTKIGHHQAFAEDLFHEFMHSKQDKEGRLPLVNLDPSTSSNLDYINQPHEKEAMIYAQDKIREVNPWVLPGVIDRELIIEKIKMNPYSDNRAQLYKQKALIEGFREEARKEKETSIQEGMKQLEMPSSDETSKQYFTPSRDSTELTAAQKFGGRNIKRLKKLGSGRDRDVYALEPGKVLKIAKNPKGLVQNTGERDLDYLDQVKQYEAGKDYVVMQRADKPGKATTELLRPLKKFYQPDFDKHKPELQEALINAGLDDLRSFDTSLGDLKGKRNWGELNGKPVIIDGGILIGSSLAPHVPVPEWATKEWSEVKTARSAFRNKGVEEKDWEQRPGRYSEWNERLADFPLPEKDDFPVIDTTSKDSLFTKIKDEPLTSTHHKIQPEFVHDENKKWVLNPEYNEGKPSKYKVKIGNKETYQSPHQKLTLITKQGVSKQDYPSPDDIGYFFDEAPINYAKASKKLILRPKEPREKSKGQDTWAQAKEGLITIFPKKENLERFRKEQAYNEEIVEVGSPLHEQNPYYPYENQINKVLIHETGHNIARPHYAKYKERIIPKSAPTTWPLERLKNLMHGLTKYKKSSDTTFYDTRLERAKKAASKEDAAESFAMLHPGIGSYSTPNPDANMPLRKKFFEEKLGEGFQYAKTPRMEYEETQTPEYFIKEALSEEARIKQSELDEEARIKREQEDKISYLGQQFPGLIIEEDLIPVTDDTSNNDNQVYLDPKKLKIKRGTNKKYEFTREHLDKYVTRELDDTGAIMLPEIFPKTTFLGNSMKNLDFSKPENIAYLSNVLNHEEEHAALQEINPPKKGLSEATIKFDKIVLPTVHKRINGEKDDTIILNPYSSQKINMTARNKLTNTDYDYDYPIILGNEEMYTEPRIDETSNDDRVYFTHNRWSAEEEKKYQKFKKEKLREDKRKDKERSIELVQENIKAREDRLRKTADYEKRRIPGTPEHEAYLEQRRERKNEISKNIKNREALLGVYITPEIESRAKALSNIPLEKLEHDLGVTKEAERKIGLNTEIVYNPDGTIDFKPMNYVEKEDEE